MAASLRYMNNPSDPAADSPSTVHERSEAHLQPGAGTPIPVIKVGRRGALVSGKEVEVFTMTLGVETIELLPLRNWGQLDIYKWRVRGKLPGTPAGLEITFDHVKLLGETVTVRDSEGPAKLEKLFSEWLEVERESLELAKKKAHSKPAAESAETLSAAGPQPLHFQVEVDNKGMVHVRCVQGKETLAAIGLNIAGFQSMISQGFMRKPHALKTGALHDWVELDGVLFSFEHGNNDAVKLEETLNRLYLPPADQTHGKEIVFYANAASSTGFDIQFPAKLGGLTENRRRPLTEETLDLLQDPQHCGLLHPGIVIKLTRPTLIFKKKTPDGGEIYLESGSANTVRVVDDDGGEKLIDLSKPVNYLHLNAVELTAVFNHPSINRHTQAAPVPLPAATVPPSRKKEEQSSAGARGLSPVGEALSQTAPRVASEPPLASMGGTGNSTTNPSRTSGVAIPENAGIPPAARFGTSPSMELESEQAHQPEPPPKLHFPTPVLRPNLWLKPILEQQPIRFDWLACLVYGRIATWLRNSREGEVFGRKCWLVEVNESELVEDVMDGRSPKAIVLEENGAFGFVNGNWMCRFERTGVTIGPNESPLKLDRVHLLGLGMDTAERFVFIVCDGYRTQLRETQVTAMLGTLRENGVALLGVKEALESSERLKVVWTVPVEQANPTDPQAIESIPSEAPAASEAVKNLAAAQG